MLIERGITLGIRDNVLLFDGEAPPSRFTKRLLALMTTVAKRRGFYIKKLYLTDQAFCDVVEWIPGNYFYGDVAPVKFWGIDFEFIEGLEEDEVYIKMFKSLGGSLFNGDNQLAIGTDGTNFLLGSY
jgi:hypothetical protein